MDFLLIKQKGGIFLKRPQSSPNHADEVFGTYTQQGDCGGAKSGLSSLAIDRIEERVQLTEAQFGALDRLSEAVNKALDTLQAACPTSIPLTPVADWR